MVPLILASIFFSIKLLLFFPIIVFEGLFIRKTTLRAGKWLYSLKLMVFLLNLVFQVVGLAYLTGDNCSLFHASLRMTREEEGGGNNNLSFLSNSDRESHNNNNNVPSQKDPLTHKCSLTPQILEIFGLIIYQFFSCWVILSIVHWVRRGLPEQA